VRHHWRNLWGPNVQKWGGTTEKFFRYFAPENGPPRLEIASDATGRHIVYGSCRPAHVDAFSAQLTAYSCAVASWMQMNGLQLNSDKTGSSVVCNDETPAPAAQVSTARRCHPNQPSSAWVSSLTKLQTWWCERMCRKQFIDTLWFSSSCLQSVTQCQWLRSRPLSSCWYRRGWITEMLSWSIIRLTFSIDFSRWWTRQHGLRHSDHISRKQRRILPQLGQRSPVATTSAFHWLKAPILGHLICIIGIGS